MNGTFCTVGNLKKPFKRFFDLIFDSIDLLPKPIIIQSGHNKINKSSLYNFKTFYDINEHQNNISNSQVVVSHAGAGTIFQCLRSNKKPIIIPRLGDLNEHINNHQLDLFKKLNALDLIYTSNSRDDFYNLIKKNIFTSNNNLKPDPLINIMKDQIIKLTK